MIDDYDIFIDMTPNEIRENLGLGTIPYRDDYLTNGTRNIYRVRNSGVDPIAIDIYENRDDIPISIRHYAPTGEPKFVGPDMARFYGILDELYPNFPTCGHPDYLGDKCVAESCKFCVEEGNWKSCPYFKE